MKKLIALLTVLGACLAAIIAVGIADAKEAKAREGVKEWLIPKIEIDGVEYTFPIEAQELVKNGWEMEDNFSVPATPGANALIIFAKDDVELFTNVSSTTGKEQPIEEGEICGIVYGIKTSNKDVPIAFPGGVVLGMKKDDVDAVLPEAYTYSEKYHSFNYVNETEQGKLEIEIRMTEDDGEVTEIRYTYWTK